MSTAAPHRERTKITTNTFRLKAARGEILTMLTAYDYAVASAVDRAGIDSILVGDSLGMVVLGYDNTLPVTMEDMLHHCKPVARGAKYALLIGDMPFMSYQASVEEAVRNAGRFLKEGGMDAVKLEGGRERADAIRATVGSGIPVQGSPWPNSPIGTRIGRIRPSGEDFRCRNSSAGRRADPRRGRMLFDRAGKHTRAAWRVGVGAVGDPDHRDWRRGGL